MIINLMKFLIGARNESKTQIVINKKDRFRNLNFISEKLKMDTNLQQIQSRVLEPRTRLMYETTKSMVRAALAEIFRMDISNVHENQQDIHTNGKNIKIF